MVFKNQTESFTHTNVLDRWLYFGLVGIVFRDKNRFWIGIVRTTKSHEHDSNNMFS